MKKLTLFSACALFLCALFTCDGQFLGDSYQFFNDTGLGNAPGKAKNDKLDTAHDAGGDDRTDGLETDFPTAYYGWHPLERIDTWFPAAADAPGLNGLPGEGIVRETHWSKLEKEIVYEINKFRNDPVKWCHDNDLHMLDGVQLENEFGLAAPPGPRSGNYRFPAQTLYPSSGLHKAALHQAMRGAMAHSDTSRVRAYAGFSGWGENVGTYTGMTGQANNRGHASPAAMIVNEFIRDRGVPNKGHRTNIANPSWDRIGVGCYKNIVVIQFGYGIQDRNP
ncbi:MAG: CAP domain-containing protein [Spirochaetaceae bacterium]|jgi:hypothetical protein|nr:CAP domain-containing protein [Spirochaetaceae bacterium]